MIAVRDQEVAASTVGINVAGVKVGSFALSAAYAGVAGALSVMVAPGWPTPPTRSPSSSSPSSS